MYDNKITINKNVTVTLALEVKRPDRKAVILNQETMYYLNVIAKDGETYLIRKRFDVVDTMLGRLAITLTPEDTDPAEEGRFLYSVSALTSTGERLLYLNDGFYADFEIQDTAMPIQRPPFIQFKFTPIRTVKVRDTDETLLDDRTTISSRLPIRKKNQTITLTLDNFSGKIVIETTTDVDPNYQSSWATFTQVTYENASDDEVFLLSDIDPNLKYFRVRMIESMVNEGSVTKLEYV